MHGIHGQLLVDAFAGPQMSGANSGVSPIQCGTFLSTTRKGFIWRWLATGSGTVSFSVCGTSASAVSEGEKGGQQRRLPYAHAACLPIAPSPAAFGENMAPVPPFPRSPGRIL